MSVRILLTDDQWASVVDALHRAADEARANNHHHQASWILEVFATLQQEAITPTDEKAGR